MMAHPTKESDPQLEAALKRLDGLVERAPDLGESAAFYRAALPVLRAAQGGVAPFTLSPEIAQRKLSAGLSLLVGEDLPLNLDAIRALLLRMCRIAESAGLAAAARPDGRSPRAAAAAQIRRAIERNELDAFAVVSALAAGEWPHIESMAADVALDAGLLRMLAQNTLKPSLRVWMQGLKGIVSLDHWRRGQCPFCGSPPALAEIQGKEGARFQRCAMCGAGWPYPRLQCAFCTNNDHRTLSFLQVEGEEEKYRVQVCDRCRGYLKIVVTFEPTPVDQLVAEDLVTLHLDLIAAEREFTRIPVL